MVFYSISLIFLSLVLMIAGVTTAFYGYFLSGLIIFIIYMYLLICNKDQDWDLFSPIFISIITITLYSIWPIICHWNNYFADNVLVSVLSYFMIFVVAFILGISLHIGEVLVKNVPLLNFRLHLRNIIIISIFSTLIGIVLYIFLLSSIGFDNPLMVLKNTFLFRVETGKLGWITYLKTFALFLLEAPFWVLLLIRQRIGRGRYLLWIYFLFLLILSFSTGSRGAVVILLLGVAFIFHETSKVKFRLNIFLIALILIIPLTLFIKYHSSLRTTDIESASQLETLAEIENIGYYDAIIFLCRRLADGADGFINIIESKDRLEFIWGRSFIDAIYLPIPRALIPDKPYSFNTQMTRKMNPEFEDIFYAAEYSIMGEMFINFHVAGLFWGGFIFGVLIKMINNYYLRNRGNIPFIYIYRPVIFMPWGWINCGIINSNANGEPLLNLVLSYIFIKMCRIK